MRPTINELVDVLKHAGKYNNKQGILIYPESVTYSRVLNEYRVRIAYKDKDGQFGYSLTFDKDVFDTEQAGSDKHPLQLNLGRSEDDK